MAATYSLNEDNHPFPVITGAGVCVAVHELSLQNKVFTRADEQLQFYARHKNVLLVFETVGWDPDLLPEITGAITWYAKQIGNPGMDITIDPAAYGIKVS